MIARVGWASMRMSRGSKECWLRNRRFFNFRRLELHTMHTAVSRFIPEVVDWRAPPVVAAIESVSGRRSIGHFDWLIEASRFLVRSHVLQVVVFC